MATLLRPVSHEDKLSLVEHLDALRTRLILSLVSFVIIFGLCFWQNDRLLDIVSRPFEKATSGQTATGGLARAQTACGDFAGDARRRAEAIEADAEARPQLRAAAKELQA